MAYSVILSLIVQPAKLIKPITLDNLKPKNNERKH